MNIHGSSQQLSAAVPQTVPLFPLFAIDSCMNIQCSSQQPSAAASLMFLFCFHFVFVFSSFSFVPFLAQVVLHYIVQDPSSHFSTFLFLISSYFDWFSFHTISFLFQIFRRSENHCFFYVFLRFCHHPAPFAHGTCECQLCFELSKTQFVRMSADFRSSVRCVEVDR